MVEIHFTQKFTDKDLVEYSRLASEAISSNEYIVFDLKDTKWASSESVTLLFGWLTYLLKNGRKFRVELPDYYTTDKRGKDFLTSIWTYWNIFSCLADKEGVEDYADMQKIIPDYFNIDSSVNKLGFNKREEHKYHENLDNDTIKIIPLRKIEVRKREYQNTIENAVSNSIEHFFVIENDIKTLLNKYHANDPFDNKVLSHIIITELLQNTYEHAFGFDEDKYCFIGLGLTKKANEEELWKFQKTIDDEKSFLVQPYFKSEKGVYNNNNYLQFTFTDFGKGLAKTIKSQLTHYKKNKSEFLGLHTSKSFSKANEDAQAIEFAFLPFSSSYPLSDRIANFEKIPRGLFFLIEYLRRYKGLMVVMSGAGRVVFDFSKDTSQKETSDGYEYRQFVRHDLNLKVNVIGTFITIYIPSLKPGEKIEVSAPPSVLSEHEKYEEISSYDYISLLQLYAQASKNIADEFEEIPNSKLVKNKLIELLDQELETRVTEAKVIFIDFQFVDLRNETKKALYYLLSTTRLKYNSICIPINIANANIINEVNNELILINTNKSEPYIYHLLPHLKFDYNNSLFELDERTYSIEWVGYTGANEYDNDKRKLTDLIYYNEEPTYSLDNFPHTKTAIRNIAHVDSRGNIQRRIRGFDELKTEYYILLKSFIEQEIKESCIMNGDLGDGSEDKTPYLFLTSRGHYQHQFISFYESLHNQQLAKFYAKFLLDRYFLEEKETKNYFDCIATVTVSAQLIGLAVRELVNDDQFPYRKVLFSNKSKSEVDMDIPLIRLSSYYSFYTEEPFNRFQNKGFNILLVNDVISTGSLVRDFISNATKRDSKVVAVFTITDTRIPEKDYIQNNKWNEEKSIFFENEFELLSICITKHFPIHKPKYNSIPATDLDGNPMVYSHEPKHINPILNSVVELKLSHSEEKHLLFQDPKDLLELIGHNYLLLGHVEMNITHSAYFVDFKRFYRLANHSDPLMRVKIIGFLKRIFERLQLKESEIAKKDQEDKISGFANLITHELKKYALNSNNIDEQKKIDEIVEALKRFEMAADFVREKYTSLDTVINLVDYLVHIDSNPSNPHKENLKRAMLALQEETYQGANVKFSPDVIFYPVFSAIEELMRDRTIVGDAFDCDPENIIPLQRFETGVGWRFNFPPKLYNYLVRHKTVLILDSGSLSGESLIQMVDAICIYEPSRIIVLSLFGRIEDFNREFFSRIREIKVKHLLTKKQKELFREEGYKGRNTTEFTDNEIKELLPEDIVPIHIYFGSNFHQFAYQSKEFCPYCEELKSITNTETSVAELPIFSENYFNERKEQIKKVHDHNIDEIQLDYLPRTKGNIEIPFVDIYSLRDTIGKITGFRFYPEYYNKINSELKEIETTQNNYEILIAILYHEPKLIKFVQNHLPYQFSVLRQFLKSIITNYDPEKLNYIWTKKIAILKCYLEIDDNLSDKKDSVWSNIQELNNLFNFALADISALNYIAHKVFQKINSANASDYENVVAINCEAVVKRQIEIQSSQNNYEQKKILERLIQHLLILNDSTSLLQCVKNICTWGLQKYSQNHTVYARLFPQTGLLNNTYNSELHERVKTDINQLINYVETNLIINFNKLQEEFEARYPELAQIINDFQDIKDISSLWIRDPQVSINATNLYDKLIQFHQNIVTKGGKYNKIINEFECCVIKEWQNLTDPHVINHKLQQRRELDTLYSQLKVNISSEIETELTDCVVTIPTLLLHLVFDNFVNNFFKLELNNVIVKVYLAVVNGNIVLTVSQDKPFDGNPNEKMALNPLGGLNKIKNIMDYFGSFEIVEQSNSCLFIFTFKNITT